MKLSKQDREWLLAKTRIHLQDYWHMNCNELSSYESMDICNVPESVGREFAEFMEEVARYKKLAGVK